MCDGRCDHSWNIPVKMSVCPPCVQGLPSTPIHWVHHNPPQPPHQTREQHVRFDLSLERPCKANNRRCWDKDNVCLRGSSLQGDRSGSLCSSSSRTCIGTSDLTGIDLLRVRTVSLSPVCSLFGTSWISFTSWHLSVFLLLPQHLCFFSLCLCYTNLTLWSSQ